MYQVKYCIQGVENQVLAFTNKKVAEQDMIAFIDSDKQRLFELGYKRKGSLKDGYIEYTKTLEDGLTKTDSSVELITQ